MSSTTEQYPLISTEPMIQAHYELMRDNGESHKMAEMLAFQQGPALETDATFLEGHCNGNQFAGQQPHIANHYRKVAEKAGQNIAGKVYLSSLAAFPGDPQAWVSGRGDVKRVIAERNWSCDGMVRHKSNVDNDCGQPKKFDGVAEDLLDAEVEQNLSDNPELAPTPKEKLEYKENLREKRRPPKELEGGQT